MREPPIFPLPGQGMTDAAAGRSTQKRALRREVLGRLRTQPPGARRAASAAIHARLFALDAFRCARGVHCFLSLPEEVDTAPVLERCREAGKAAFVPFQIPGEGRLGVARWSPHLALTEGPFGVREPVPATEGEWTEIDLVIVPGVAFDRAGRRLGRGRGYYDGFLAALAERKGWALAPLAARKPRQGLRWIALAFGVQIVSRVPSDSWDIPMDAILTENEEILTTARDDR
jgi:5-formyltetrahydrofolate cyclo-ligase